MERRNFFKRLFSGADTPAAAMLTPAQQGHSRTHRLFALGEDPFLGEIQMVPFNFAPMGWAFCDGRVLSIASNTALFSILGPTYGGNGITNFALPNLQGQFPIGAGQGPGLRERYLGEPGGSETVTLTTVQLPSVTLNAPTVTVRGTGGSQGVGLTTGKQVGAATLSGSNSALPVNNMPPFLAINFIIALQGIFPPRS